MRVAVATLARGRARHLARQAEAVARLQPAATAHVVVSMDPSPPRVPGAMVLHRPVADGQPLPLAAARNEAIAAAGEHADLVLCLDADCLPEPGVLREFALASRATGGRSLLAGPVGRLPELPQEAGLPDTRMLMAARSRARQGGRPVPAAGAVVPAARHELFWSLAFAVSPETHGRIGGFCEEYVGYGAEDTDYAFAARAAGVPLHWVGGAWCHHQGHPVSNPPVEHLEAIVANARRFHARWERWPMEGWLAAFAQDGLVDWTPDGARLELQADASAAR